MAVITPLDAADMAAALEHFDLGNPVDFAPASLGIENTNYFLTTDDGQRRHHLVLTLLETDDNHDALLVPLLTRLEHAGLPVPAPLASRRGERTGWLRGRPALLAPCLPGEHPLAPTPAQCAAIGRFLAAMHAAAAPLADSAPPHPRDAAWMHREAGNHARWLPPVDRQLIEQAIATWRALQRRADAAALPSGVVHGDLFRDNALFNAHGLSGVLDFHHAARHWLVFDLAVVLNDWCTAADGRVSREHALALLRAYHRARPLGTLEVLLLPEVMAGAALCFWLSRLPGWRGLLGPDAPRKDPGDQAAIVRTQLRTPLRLDPALLPGPA